MPTITMLFQVRDPSMLEAVQAGDTLKLVAAKVAGAYTATHLAISR